MLSLANASNKVHFGQLEDVEPSCMMMYLVRCCCIMTAPVMLLTECVTLNGLFDVKWFYEKNCPPVTSPHIPNFAYQKFLAAQITT